MPRKYLIKNLNMNAMKLTKRKRFRRFYGSAVAKKL